MKSHLLLFAICSSAVAHHSTGEEDWTPPTSTLDYPVHPPQHTYKTEIVTSTIKDAYTSKHVSSFYHSSSCSTSTSTSISCTSNCQIDVTATKLEYPATVIVSTEYYPVTSVDVYLDSNGQTTSSSTTTLTIPPPATTLTWVYSSVTLTYPTVYAAYEEFSHITVEPASTTCSSETLSLTLPSPTDWEPLIIPTAEIENPALVPTVIVDYLNSLPTVIEQLGRSIGASACDPLVSTAPESDTKTLPSVTSLTTVPALEATTNTHTAISDTAPTSTEAPPPPPPPSTTVIPSITSAPPPSTTSAPLEVTTNAAVHARGKVMFGGVEGWLIGAAGLGMGWI